MTPEGVQGVKRGFEAREERCPMLYAWKLYDVVSLGNVVSNRIV